MLRPLLSPLVLLLSVAITGCAPTVRVHVLRPAPLNLGNVKRISLVQPQQHHDALDTVISQLKYQASVNGHLEFTDRLMVVQEASGSAEVLERPTGEPLAPDEVALRVDVAQWDAHMESKNRMEKWPNSGIAAPKRIDYYVAKVVLVATLFHPSGKTLLFRRRYKATAQDEQYKDWALSQASSWAVSRLLREITPFSVSQEIRLDGDDEALKPILHLAEQGNIPDALIAMQGHVQRHPGNVSALYNLAVLLDASGQYAEALAHYDRAIMLSNKAYYAVMRRACLQRKFSQDALSQAMP